MLTSAFVSWKFRFFALQFHFLAFPILKPQVVHFSSRIKLDLFVAGQMTRIRTKWSPQYRALDVSQAHKKLPEHTYFKKT
jgi:hypothetical protein